METILRLVMEGFGGCESALDVCREHLHRLVDRGDITEDQLEDILFDIRNSLLARRKALFDGARNECLRLLDRVPLVTEESFQMLEERVGALEQGHPEKGLPKL